MILSFYKKQKPFMFANFLFFWFLKGWEGREIVREKKICGADE